MIAYRAFLFATAATLAHAAAAQVGDPEQPGETSAETRLDAGLAVTGGYTDNVFVTRNDEVGDFLFTLEPNLRFTFADGPDSLVLRAEGEIGRYAEQVSEDYDDWLLRADGRLQVASGLTAVAGGEWRWDHENRASPDAVNGLEPTEYRRGYGYGGLILSRGSINARAAATVTRYDFSDVLAAGGTINNDDRDRTQWDFGLRLGHELGGETELFVQGAYDVRNYDSMFDDFAFTRDSEGFSLVAGLRKRFSNRLSGEIFAGYLRQGYDDPRLSDVETVDFGALLDWNGPSGLSATMRVDRSVEETTLPGSSAYVLTSGSFTVRLAPDPRVLVGTSISGAHYDYRGFPRSEFVTEASLWGRYWLGRHVYLGLDYSFAQRSSNAAGFDYDENRLFFRLGTQLRPRYDEAAAGSGFGGEAPGGPYAALFLGHGTLTTGVDGPRGPGSNTADFGEDGLSYGAAIGYGLVSGPVYFGLEIEGMLDGPDWLHTADRVFSVAKNNSIGAAARLGYVTPWGDLAYARFGLHSTEFGTYYLHAGNLYDEDDSELGLGYGLGVETRLGGRGFVRAEYLMTSYDDYDVPTGGGNFDNFSSTESQFRIGGGIRFGAVREEREAVERVDFGGPYAGLQIGHGAVATRNMGIRSGGTEVDINRSSHGPLLGGFAGYGAMLGDFYLGAEAEADVSNVDWNIERDPNGRIYSAEHEYSFGFAGRLGHRLSDSTLLYARAGMVRTRFDVHYSTTNVTVRAQDTQTGLRFGGGLELGLGGDARLRLDYSRTVYRDYDVEYGLNSDSFDHGETLVRLGLLIGF